MIRKLSALIGALTLLFAVSACSPSAEEITVNPEAIVIDVRTLGEFADGHLKGAELLDITNGEFHGALDQLDPEAEYLLYCRSGNRSGQAADIMTQAGFTSATNLGSVQDASDATGIEITR